MSDTPRTDAETKALTIGCGDGEPVKIVLADFARQLERELNEAKEQNRVLRIAQHACVDCDHTLEQSRDAWRKCAESLAEGVEAHPCVCGYCCKCKALEQFNKLKQTYGK